MPKHDPSSEHSDSYDSSCQDSEHRQSLPWYRAGLAFECTGCGNCCSGPQTGFVWVDQEEIESIAQKIGMQDDLDRFERTFVRNVGARRSLVEYSDGDCIFLDPKTRGCSVYEVRPKQCRTWPFWQSNLESPSKWGQAAKSCPGCNKGKLYTLEQIDRIQDHGTNPPTS
jgi:Fe-S-cluster containining protein